MQFDENSREKVEKLDGEIIFPKNEKREYPRVPMRIKVKYRVIGGDEAEKLLNRLVDANKVIKEGDLGETIDVSRSGLLMLVNEEIPIRSFIAVNMYISVPGISCTCKAVAEVVRRERCSEGAYNYRIALKFIKLAHDNMKSYKYCEVEDLIKINETGA
jgi:hypothetical protein